MGAEFSSQVKRVGEKGGRREGRILGFFFLIKYVINIW